MAEDTLMPVQVFEEISELEKKFAEVEIDALRRKEHALKPLFVSRQNLVSQIPDFWQTVLLNGPEEVQQFFSPIDLPILTALKSFSVDRYQINSPDGGEPRSLRFTFEFEKNDVFEDEKLIKDFEYRSNHDGTGNLISTPTAIKWKSKKKDVTRGLLDGAVELWAAEEALKLKNGEQEVDIVDREALWQHEKLRERLAKIDEENDDEEPSFMNWFGFRGAIVAQPPKPAQDGDADSDEGEDDEEDGMLEVEIFPAGEEVAICLAEDFWPNVMDYYIQSQSEPVPDFEEDDDMHSDEDGSDDEIPELIPMEEPARPAKKQRTR